MKPLPQREPASSKNRSTRALDVADMVLFGLFLAVLFAVAAGIFVGHNGLDWAEAALPVFACLTTLASLSRRLSIQNALLAAAILAGIGTFTQVIGAKTEIPFGPIVYQDCGPLLFNAVPWFAPFLWIVVVLNARGVARMILRPWRKTRTYGFRAFALTATLALATEFALEPFATKVKHYWLWKPTRLPVDWYGAPITDFLGWILTLLVMLAFATPALMDKRQRKTPANYKPLLAWISLNLLFVVGTAAQGLWLATLVTAVITAVATAFAVRGLRW